MTGRIEINHVFPDETDYVIWTLRKVSNLLTLVPATFYDGVTTLTNQTKFVYPAPHPQSTMVLTDIDPVMYLVTPYRSADGVSLDQQLDVQLAVDASSGAQFPITIYEYVVDRGESGTDPGEEWADPETGDHGLRDARLLNKTYRIVERGTSLLLLAEYTDRSDDGGGFDFDDPDKNFEAPGVYFAIVSNRVDGGSALSSGGSDFNDIIEITGDTAFDSSTMNNKVLVAAYAGANKVITLTMQNLMVLPDCKFRVITHGGTQWFLTIQLDAGDVVSFIGYDDFNAIHLGKGEMIEIMIRENVMYVTNYDGDYKRVMREDGVKALEVNGVYGNGTQYNQADVPRLMQMIDKKGVPTVTEAAWATGTVYDYIVEENGTLSPTVYATKTVYEKKGMYARDDIGGTIRVPDLRDMFRRYMKYTDSTDDPERKPSGQVSGLQIDSFAAHKHQTSNSDGAAGGGKHTTGNQTQEGGNLETYRTRGYNGVETRGINYGELPQIII